jgi:predicted DCC family thiol-disulfide oxidoreductase YuxK
MHRPVRYPLTIFYDGACASCAAEVRALEARDHGRRLKLVDCTAPGFDDTVLAGTCIRPEELLDTIHARDNYGRWLAGADVLEAASAVAGPRLVSPAPCLRHYRSLRAA